MKRYLLFLALAGCGSSGSMLKERKLKKDELMCEQWTKLGTFQGCWKCGGDLDLILGEYRSFVVSSDARGWVYVGKFEEIGGNNLVIDFEDLWSKRSHHLVFYYQNDTTSFLTIDKKETCKRYL